MYSVERILSLLLIQYCEEKFEVGHSWDLKGYNYRKKGSPVGFSAEAIKK